MPETMYDALFPAEGVSVDRGHNEPGSAPADACFVSSSWGGGNSEWLKDGDASMKDAQKPDHMSLNTLIGKLREGKYVIPDFQREFEWGAQDIRDLMRSIFLDYYIGSLLLWKGKKETFGALSCERIYGFHGDDDRPEFIVLDGQQRLTALYYAFLAPDKPLPNRASRAVYLMRVDKFMNGEHDDAFHYEWLSRRVTRILGSQEVQYAEHVFPLSVVGEGGWALGNWVQGYEQHWTEAKARAEEDGDDAAARQAELHAVDAKGFGEILQGITGQYQISYIELDQEIKIEKVCDIFTQINSRGVRLDVFDLMNALLVPEGVRLKHMWREAEDMLKFADSSRMNVYILQAMSIMLQSYCSPRYLYYLLPGREKQVRDPDGTRRQETLVRDVDEFRKRWDQAVDALKSALDLLRHPREFGVVSSKYLPYASILPVFAALQLHAKESPPEIQLEARRKIRLWYWASVFTNRYASAVESTSARDFNDVRHWIRDDDAEPAPVPEFRDRIRRMELRGAVKHSSSVYNGIFNLLVLRGAQDWITGKHPQHDDLDDHHIVPSSWGRRNNLEGDLVNTILNRTPLTADTNRKVIGDRLPNAYLPELIKRNGKKAVNEVLEAHFISPAARDILLHDPFTPDDFEAFITERQRTILEAIETLLVK